MADLHTGDKNGDRLTADDYSSVIETGDGRKYTGLSDMGAYERASEDLKNGKLSQQEFDKVTNIAKNHANEDPGFITPDEVNEVGAKVIDDKFKAAGGLLVENEMPAEERSAATAPTASKDLHPSDKNEDGKLTSEDYSAERETGDGRKYTGLSDMGAYERASEDLKNGKLSREEFDRVTNVATEHKKMDSGFITSDEINEVRANVTDNTLETAGGFSIDNGTPPKEQSKPEAPSPQQSRATSFGNIDLKAAASYAAANRNNADSMPQDLSNIGQVSLQIPNYAQRSGGIEIS